VRSVTTRASAQSAVRCFDGPGLAVTQPPTPRPALVTWPVPVVSSGSTVQPHHTSTGAYRACLSPCHISPGCRWSPSVLVHAAGCQGRCKDVLPGACSGMRGYGVGGRHSAHAQARPEQPLRAPRPERQQQGPVRQLLQRLSRADVLRSGLVGALLVGALAHARRAACSAAAACLTPRRRAPRAGLLSSPLWLQRRARASTAAPELPTFVPAGQVRPVMCALCGRPVGHGGAEPCGAVAGPDEDSGGQVPLRLPTPAAPAPPAWPRTR